MTTRALSMLINASQAAESERETVSELETFEKDGGKMVVVLSGIILFSAVCANLLHTKHVSWFPESMVLVVLGAVVGLILPMGSESVSDWAIKHISIEAESVINEMTLNWFLLPMIIFEAGWSLKHRDFLSQFPYILLFAIFGTLISMAVVGSLILATSEYHGVTAPRVAFAYAALISAVDPVATLATYGSLGVDPLLNTIVFGESVINDAVAIVLFKTLNEVPAEAYKHMTMPQLISQLGGGVIFLLSSSLALGIVLGVIYVLIIRFARMGHTTSICALFIFFSSFFTYNLAESVLGLSGIIAVLFCGMLMGGWASPHMSSEGTMFTSFLLKQTASISDMIVFLFVGLAVVYVSRKGLVLGCWVSLFCLLGRAVATVPLANLTNLIKRRVHFRRPADKLHTLSWQHIVMMWHAGLRGGIALVLTLELDDWVDDIDGVGTKEALRNCTLIVICAFMLIFGGSTKFMLESLGIELGGDTKLVHHKGYLKDCMQNFKQTYMIPVLVGNQDHDDEASNVVEDILAEEGDDVIVTPSRMQSKRTSNQTSQMFQLFGTHDPTHADEVNTIHPRKHHHRRDSIESSGTDDETSTEEETSS